MIYLDLDKAYREGSHAPRAEIYSFPLSDTCCRAVAALFISASLSSFLSSSQTLRTRAVDFFLCRKIVKMNYA